MLSPLLANIALHGFETAIREKFQQFHKQPGHKRRTPWKPQIIRYADDFVIFHRNLEALKRAKQIAEDWLNDMGLELKPSKTRITHTLKEINGSAGFDFLGFNIRQYPRGKNRCMRDVHSRPVGFTLTIKPSKESQKRFITKVRDIIMRNRAIDQAGLIRLMNPVIRGWGNYYSAVVSKRVFQKMDMHIYKKLWSWAIRRHPKKNHKWAAHKYWLLKTRGWVFGIDGKMTLNKLADISIKRHILVKGSRSPYDGDAFYWSSRLGRHPLIPQSLANLIKRQKGYCPECGRFFVPGDCVTVIRSKTGNTDSQRPLAVLVHQHCQDLPDRRCTMTEYHFTEEPYEGKPSRTVLKASANREVCT